MTKMVGIAVVVVFVLMMMIILVVINPFTRVGATFEIEAIEICWMNKQSGGINLP